MLNSWFVSRRFSAQALASIILPLVRCVSFPAAGKMTEFHTVSCGASLWTAGHLRRVDYVAHCRDSPQVHPRRFQGAGYCYLWSLRLARRRRCRSHGVSLRDVQRTTRSTAFYTASREDKLVEVWSQAKARTETQQKVDSTAQSSRDASRVASWVMGQPRKSIPRQIRERHPTQGSTCTVIFRSP